MADKMDRIARAKQFMPFSALKGYSEALHKKEKNVVPKIELSEEYQAEINEKLLQARINEVITVVYFDKNEYLTITGMISKIDKSLQMIQVVNTKIPFENIYEIS